MVSTGFLIFNYLLISFDLADASMAPQSFLEDEMRDVNSMIVDDHGE
jgi:hypothetical protein